MNGFFPLQEPYYPLWGPSVERREWSALEDPVKNGACLRHVRPRRGLKGRVRRLGSVGVRNSLGTLCPQMG